MGAILSAGGGLPKVGGPLVWSYLAFSTGLFLFEQYLEVRQLRKNRETEPPAELQGTVPQEKFLEAQAYQKDKRIFGFFRDWIICFREKVDLFVLSPFLWHYAASTFPDSEYKTTLFWFFLQQWVDKPISIPISLWSNFVVEAKHGFNKMTLKLFFTDLVKSELLAYFFGGLLIPLLIWIVNSTGDRFYLYLWAACQTLIFVMLWVYPTFIQPLFNKFEEVKDQGLKAAIEDLAKGLEFPLYKLFQIDGSKRSSHSNAYFFGFWKFKRIVLFDTLLQLNKDKTFESGPKGLKISTESGRVVSVDEEKQCEEGWLIEKISIADGDAKTYAEAKEQELVKFGSDGEWMVEDGKKVTITFMVKKRKQEDILAILCHELGHWKFGHTLFNLCISSAHIFALFWLFGFVMYSGDTSKDIIRQFGYGETQAVMVSFSVFSLLLSPTEAFLQVMMIMLSRTFEFQADSFAAKMGRSKALQSGLYQIHEENKGDLNPDPWWGWYHLSHPSLVERLRALKALDASSPEKKTK